MSYTTRDRFISTYTEAEAYLGGRHERRLPGVATVLHYVTGKAGPIAVRYHYTDVVTFTENGVVTLDTEGYTTVTTKAWINQYIPAGYYVFQEHYAWYLHCRFGNVDFEDGMAVMEGK